MELRGLNHDLLGRLLSASTLRQRVIADNVANQNTPGYRRQEVAFEELLREAFERGKDDTSQIEARIVEVSSTLARDLGIPEVIIPMILCLRKKLHQMIHQRWLIPQK